MIKAKLLNELNGRTYFILGLTDEDINSLQGGNPLGLVMSAFGFDEKTLPDTVVLLYAPTNEAVQAKIKAIEVHAIGLTFPSDLGAN